MVRDFVDAARRRGASDDDIMRVVGAALHR